MKIRELCETERPREKMLIKGAAALSEAELLAVLLRSGTRECGAVDLANKLLSLAEGSLVRLFSMTLPDLKQISGIGSEKACGVMAACELGRRFLEEEVRIDSAPLSTPRRVFELMIPSLKGMAHEEFWVLFLNKQSRLLAKQKLSSGGLDSTVIDNRMVMQAALQRNAAAIILVHNHPSGDPHPSHGDITQTEMLKKATAGFGVTFLDHVIISDDSFFSFADDRMYGA